MFQNKIVETEMQKAADAADISVLFFQLVLIFGPFRQFWVIFGLFWVIFGPFFGANFLAKNVSLLFLLLFASLHQRQL